MDIGRKITKITDEFYTLRFLFKQDGEILYTTKERVGKAFPTTIDIKGRIYIPTDLPEGDILDEKPFAYFGGYLSLSTFNHMIFFHDSEEINKYNLEMIYKNIHTYESMKEFLEDLKSSDHKRKIKERIDTKVLIQIKKRKRKKFVLDIYPEIDVKISFKPYYIYTELRFAEKEKLLEGRENKEASNILKNFYDEDEKNFYRRYRFQIPKLFLDFCEIDLEKDKIILFKMDDEIEIWEKKSWENSINKEIWLSKVGKYIVDKEKENVKFVSAKKDYIISLIMSE